MSIGGVRRGRLPARALRRVDSMYIELDSSVAGKITIAIARPGRAICSVRRFVRYHGAEALVRLLDLACQRFQVRLDKVCAVAVVASGGQLATQAGSPRASFTHLRAAVVVGNALAYGLGVPVVAIQETGSRDLVVQIKHALKNKRSSGVSPAYSKEPNITKSMKQS